MHSLRNTAAAGLALALTALGAGPAMAAPEPGQAFPSLAVRDVTNVTRRTDELRGQPALVIVVTDPNAQAASSRWVDAAVARLRGRGVRVVTLVALDLSSLVPSGMVRSRAQRQTPRARWQTTWLDVHGSAQDRLGLDDGTREPWVFALDETGQVRASAHAAVTAPDAERVFSALQSR